MRLFPTRYDVWTPESKRLLVFALVWFPHGSLMSVDRVFAVTWICHAIVAGVWGFSWLWRAGSENRRFYLHRKWAGSECAVCRLALLWNLSGSMRLKWLHEEWGGSPCHVCGAEADERCDTGLHG